MTGAGPRAWLQHGDIGICACGVRIEVFYESIDPSTVSGRLQLQHADFEVVSNRVRAWRFEYSDPFSNGTAGTDRHFGGSNFNDWCPSRPRLRSEFYVDCESQKQATPPRGGIAHGEPVDRATQWGLENDQDMLRFPELQGSDKGGGKDGDMFGAHLPGARVRADLPGDGSEPDVWSSSRSASAWTRRTAPSSTTALRSPRPGSCPLAWARKGRPCLRAPPAWRQRS